MPSPYSNGASVTYINTATLGAGRFVADGEKWGGGIGTAVTLTYSFPGNSTVGNYAYFTNPYPDGGIDYGEWKSWTRLSGPEMQAVKTALDTWSHFANVTFVGTTDNSANVGELRFAKSAELGSDAAAHAYFPFADASAGDVWFNPSDFNDDGGGVPLGSYDFHTIIHEIGHALGLKHPFDAASNAPANISPAAQDNYFYTIMSYTASPWSAAQDNYASFFPTTPMYNDLLAIEGMYGRRAYNTGNNVYTFNDGVRYWQTIHDTFGTDRIVYVGVENVTINLNPGAFSTLSEAISFRNAGGSTVTSKATVCIGPGVAIEVAIGGNGNDSLLGSGIGNNLVGGFGNDSLRGGFGNDTLNGGPGNDAFVFNTLPNASTNRDVVQDYNTVQDSIYLENAIFTKLAPVAHLNPAYFWAGTAAHDANDFIIYNRAAGLLMYDSNANLAGGVVQVAVFQHLPALTAFEFTVI